MILFLIILGISILSIAVGAFAAYKEKHRYYSNWFYVSGAFLVFGIILAIVSSVLLIVVPIECNRDLSVFINQKEYIENYEPTSEYDTAAITNKKVELNEWLYAVQHTKEHFPICSFYGDEILQIEPIK